MDETRELGTALLELRRQSHQRGETLTKAMSPLEMKADAGSGQVSGYASKWWVVDGYGEVTAPGCFAQSIKDRGPDGANRIVFRYEHEHTVGNHTKMVEDGDGLYIEAHVVDDGQWGTVLRRHLADPNGPVYGLSIGYRTLRVRAATEADPLIWDYAPDWMKERPDPAMIMVLQSVRHKEDSAVTFPAVDNALIDDYKAEAPVQLERLLASVKAGTLTESQVGLLREIAAALPAASAPETAQAAAQPGAKADSDDGLLILDLLVAEYERLAA